MKGLRGPSLTLKGASSDILLSLFANEICVFCNILLTCLVFCNQLDPNQPQMIDLLHKVSNYCTFGCISLKWHKVKKIAFNIASFGLHHVNSDLLNTFCFPFILAYIIFARWFCWKVQFCSQVGPNDDCSPGAQLSTTGCKNKLDFQTLLK